MEEELRREIVGKQLFVTVKKIDPSNPREDFETIEKRCYSLPQEESNAPRRIKIKKKKKKKTIPGILFFAHEVEL